MSLGIKETKEAVIAANKLAILALTAAKDGLDIGDALTLGKALLTDSDYLEGIRGISEVMAEAKDLDASEIGDLLKIQTEFVFEILALLGRKSSLFSSMGVPMRPTPTPTPTPNPGSGVTPPKEGPSAP